MVPLSRPSAPQKRRSRETEKQIVEQGIGKRPSVLRFGRLSAGRTPFLSAGASISSLRIGWILPSFVPCAPRVRDGRVPHGSCLEGPSPVLAVAPRGRGSLRATRSGLSFGQSASPGAGGAAATGIRLCRSCLRLRGAVLRGGFREARMTGLSLRRPGYREALGRPPSGMSRGAGAESGERRAESGEPRAGSPAFGAQGVHHVHPVHCVHRL